MRRIIIGFLFAAVCALGLAPPASAEPDENRAIVDEAPDTVSTAISSANSTMLACENENCHSITTYDQVACENENCRFMDNQAALSDKDPTLKLINGIAIAQADPTYRPVGTAIVTIETIAHKTANGPCKDVVPRRDGQCIVIDAHHVQGPCTA